MHSTCSREGACPLCQGTSVGTAGVGNESEMWRFTRDVRTLVESKDAGFTKIISDINKILERSVTINARPNIHHEVTKVPTSTEMNPLNDSDYDEGGQEQSPGHL